MNLTPEQKKILVVLAAFFVLDNCITLYGVFFYGPGFYEANPLLGYFLKISPWVFAGVITIAKLGALGLLILMVEYCNKPLGNSRWGTGLCSYATLIMGSSLAFLTYLNLA